MSVWIIETTVTVSIVVAIGLAVSAMLRRQPAALRHWVLAIAIACAWAMPAARIVMPSWIGVPVWRAVGDARSRPSAPRERLGPPIASSTVTAAASVSSATKLRLPASKTTDVAGRRGSVLWAVWTVGSLISVCTLLIGLMRLQSLVSRSHHVDAGPWHDVTERTRAAFGLSSQIRLLQSDHPSLLIAWGWRRPTVLLPAAAPTWSADRIEVVMAHELAHIARRDWPWQMLVAALRAIYWFNPLVWILVSRLRVESEQACDDVVLESGVDSSAYASHLLVLARTLRHSRGEWALPAAAIARASHLEGRIRAMLNSELNRRPISWRARVATASVLVALALGVAGVRGQSVYYKLSGTVVDPTGRILPNATLVLTNGGTGAKYEVRSNASGRFEFVGLPQGTYTLKASLAGFATLTWSDINVATDIDQTLQLRVGSIQETITVRGTVGASSPLDAAALQRRADARRRGSERVQQALAQCAAGGAASSVGGNLLPPMKLEDVKPIYPDALKASGISGIVTLEAVIGTDGLVRDVQAVSGPHPDLEAAAGTAVREWEFSPTLLNCQAIDVTMRVTVNFAAEE